MAAVSVPEVGTGRYKSPMVYLKDAYHHASGPTTSSDLCIYCNL